ncbi:hypothetical protein ACWEVM_22010 [Streptomyces bauhiniae]|uniref:hypothetical protein n=1 Tax=Streptomyces bauhiniae TaxID=2340725 RepID=UPI0036D12301
MNKPLALAFVITTASAVTAIAAAQDNYGVCAVALVTLAAGALGAVLISRTAAPWPPRRLFRSPVRHFRRVLMVRAEIMLRPELLVPLVRLGSAVLRVPGVRRMGSVPIVQSSTQPTLLGLLP